MSAFAASWLNFTILIAALVWKLRQPTKTFVRERSEGLGRELVDVRERLARAKAVYDEYSSRLQAIESELRAVREEVKREGLMVRDNIVAEANRLAGVIRSDAKASSETAVAEFKYALVSRFGLQILKRVEEIVSQRLTRDDQQRMNKEFSRLVEAQR